MDIRLPYNPLPKQKEFLACNNDIVLYSGAFGAGKSSTLCIAVLREALNNKSNRILICRKRMTDLRNTTMKTFFEILPPTSDLIKRWHKTENCLTLVNNTEIWFGGFDISSKWASSELGCWAMDEATDFKEDDFNMLVSRLRKRNIKKHRGFLACNPSTKMHWIYRCFFDEREDNNYGVVETISLDNKFLPPATLKRYQVWKKSNPDYYKRYILGQWGILEGLVYKTFNTDHNIRDFKINTGWTFFRAIDWGYENPFVCLWIGLDPDDNIYVFDELYLKQVLPGELAEIVRDKYNNPDFLITYADPSGASSIAEFEKRGIYIQKADNTIEPGIRKVMEMMQKIFIHPRCKNTIKEFQSYRWMENKGDKNKPEIPVKANDHAMDALRYFVYTHFTITDYTGLLI